MNKGVKDQIHSGLMAFYNCYRRDARKLKREFSLNFNDFKSLVNQNCYYCGIEPIARHRKSRNSHYNFYANGIDRVINSIGYVKSNLVSCCFDCNRAKYSKSSKDFLKWIRRLTAYQIDKDQGLV